MVRESIDHREIPLLKLLYKKIIYIYIYINREREIKKNKLSVPIGISKISWMEFNTFILADLSISWFDWLTQFNPEKKRKEREKKRNCCSVFIGVHPAFNEDRMKTSKSDWIGRVSAKSMNSFGCHFRHQHEYSAGKRAMDPLDKTSMEERRKGREKGRKKFKSTSPQRRRREPLSYKCRRKL